MRQFILLAFLYLFAGQAIGAEITIKSYNPDNDEVRQSADFNYGKPFILLEGEIVPGDAQRLREQAAILNSWGAPLVLMLNSPGGNVSEALKIADFVRSSWATTWVKGKTVPVKEKDRSVAACDSACPIIFFAGIERRYSSDNWRHYDADDPYIIPMENRPPDPKDLPFLPDWMKDDYDIYGNKIPKMEVTKVLGLHRPYFDAGFNKQLSGEVAKDMYAELENTLRAKLDSYGVPTALIERMMRTSSGKIDRINGSELFELMPRIEPWFDEWRLSKCGELSQEESLDLATSRFNNELAEQGLEGFGRKFSQSYVDFLQSREAEIDNCRTALVVNQQKQIIQNEPSSVAASEE